MGRGCYPSDVVLQLMTVATDGCKERCLRRRLVETAQHETGKIIQDQERGGGMLVLSRKPGEKILIGDNVTVTIVRIGPNTVRIGIEAPRDMNIVREELCEHAGHIDEQVNGHSETDSL